MSLKNPSIGIILGSSTALSAPIATSITNEYISEKKGYINLRNWINVNTLLHEKSMKTSLVDKKIGEKDALELRKTCNLYLDKRKETMKITQFEVDDFFGEKIERWIYPFYQNR